MRHFVRYALEVFVCFILVHTFYSVSRRQVPYFADRTRESLNDSLILQLTNQFNSNELHMPTKEPYDAIRDDVARDLQRQVRVLCWIMTAPKNHWSKARHVKNTWGKRCNILLFISSEEDSRLPTIKVPSTEGYDTLWGKTREGFRYAWEHYRDQADWFLKADDDSFIILENLRYFLYNYNASDPLYFGHKFRAYVKSGYMQGGSGYVLSKESLKRFVEIGLQDVEKCNPGEAPEDVEISRCMANLGCKGMDTRDSFGRNRFLPLQLESHLTLGLTDETWFWEIHPSFYPIRKGLDCCSDTAIGFHQVQPNQMYLYDYLLYHVSPFGFEHIRSKLQSKPQLPPDFNLQALPFSGPSSADLQWAEELRESVARESNRFKNDESGQN